jgi:hypothetical protein
MKLSFFVLLLLFGLIAIESCKSDAGMNAEDLIGEWTVVNARRNGKITELVNGATFVFDDKGYMSTDITGSKDNGAYTFEEPILTYHGDSEVLYNLNKLTRDSMRLAVDLQGLNFVLDLVKQQSKK